MRKIVIPLLAILFVAAIFSFAFTYTVRFTEVAVKTTFGKAREGAQQTDPGLKFKWPYPIQSVTKYDRRIRLVSARSETQQTAEGFQIVVESYATYRVSDALKFFQQFSDAGERSVDHFRKAESSVLRDSLRSALGETSKYRMDQLFTPELGASKLPELEGRILELLSGTDETGKSLGDYGVEVVGVGIDRILLPEETTKAVIDRMGANRDRLAAEYESEGDSIARTIEDSASSDAEKIRAFAQRRAAEIRARGEQEAAPFLAQQNANPELAAFLQKLALIRDAYSRKFTLVLSASNYGLDLMKPDALQGIQPGDVPGIPPSAVPMTAGADEPGTRP